MVEKLDDGHAGGKGRSGAAIVDAVAASSATDAVCDGAKGVPLLFGLGIVVGAVTSAVNGLVGEVDRLNCAGGKRDDRVPQLRQRASAESRVRALLWCREGECHRERD